MPKLKIAPYCPTCKKLLDGFTGVNHNRNPKPGDVTVCVYCNQVLQFSDDLSSLIPPTPEVIEDRQLADLFRKFLDWRLTHQKGSLTWHYHICKRERPDKCISVVISDVGKEPGGMYQNVRFCNDNPDCREKAKTFLLDPKWKIRSSFFHE